MPDPSTDPASAPIAMRVGDLSFTVDGCDLVDVYWGDTKALDRIVMSVRDRNWDTITPTGIQIQTIGSDVDGDGNGLAIDIRARYDSDDVCLRWSGRIDVTSLGLLRYVMNASAATDFQYCRIGYCLLYPEQSARGRPYVARRQDWAIRGRLPDLIAPQTIVDGVEQPLVPACNAFELDLSGCCVVAEFTGDEFEMEDQRNWTDASFKLYCTPIAKGYPHQAHAGDHFDQSVSLSFLSEGARATGTRYALKNPLVIDPQNLPPVHIGQLGLGLSTELNRPLTSPELAKVRALDIAHIRVDIARQRNAVGTLRRAIEDASALGCGLELALFTSLDEVTDLIRNLSSDLATAPLSRVIVLTPRELGYQPVRRDLVDRVHAALIDLRGAEIAVGSGTDGDFAELNRERPAGRVGDFLAYAMNPQVHAFDDKSVMSTLPTQGGTVRTARSFAGDEPIVVSPVTLRARFNPAASAVDVTDRPTSDPRQSGPFAAAWLLGSVISLATAGASSTTYFETAGPRGVIAIIPPKGPPRVYPTWHVLHDLARSRSRPVRAIITDDIAALTFDTTLLLANLRCDIREVCIRVHGPTNIRVLDVAAAAKTAADPDTFRVTPRTVNSTDDGLSLTLPSYTYTWMRWGQ